MSTLYHHLKDILLHGLITVAIIGIIQCVLPLVNDIVRNEQFGQTRPDANNPRPHTSLHTENNHPYDYPQGYLLPTPTQGHYFADNYLPLVPADNSYVPRKVYHFVQHTHTDAGWLRTMDQYYMAAVEDILRTSSTHLHSSHGYGDKFTFANYDFIKLFMERFPSKDQKSYLKEGVKNGSYEIINSGIAMPDQAITYFEDLINNLEYGREYGLKTFGNISRYGWTIDNFGQSAFHARLYAELGYESITSTRIGNKIRDKLRYSKNLNLIWNHTYPEYDIFTHFFSYHYDPPHPVCHIGAYEWQRILSPDWSMFDTTLSMFHSMVREYRNYNELNVLIGMGNDFQYYNYPSAQKSNLHLFYVLRSNNNSLFVNSTFLVSTAHEYYTAIKAENLQYQPSPQEDFMPYSTIRDDLLSVWSGFYATRPYLKYSIRTYSQWVRSISSLIALQTVRSGRLSEYYDWTYSGMEEIRFIQGILQHHDAITGTCHRQVAGDYFDMIEKGCSQGEYILKENTKNTLLSNFPPDMKINIMSNTDLREWTGEDLCVGLLPSLHTPSTLTLALSLPALPPSLPNRTAMCGQNICLVTVDIINGQMNRVIGIDGDKGMEGVDVGLEEGQRYVWKEGDCAFEYNSTSLSITLFPDTSNETKISVSVHLHTDTVFDFPDKIHQEMGIYTMHLFSRDPQPLGLSTPRLIIFPNGRARIEAKNPYYDIALGVEIIDGVIKSMIIQGPIATPKVYEFVVRYNVAKLKAGFPNFKTDSNGFNMINRVYEETAKPQSSYYPVAKFIQIEADDLQFTVSVDRSVGATSPRPGVIEIMFNRASGSDDTYGMPEHFIEGKTIIVQHTLILEKKGGQAHRKLQVQEDSTGILITAKSTGKKSCHGIPIDFFDPNSSRPTPQNNTLQSQYIKTFLDLALDAIKIRLYNLNERETITIENVRDFIRKRYNIPRQITIEERSLDYNQPISEILEQPYMWRNVTALKKAYAEETIGEKVVLKPLKMKTYKIIVDKPAK
jgi:hypothetical protein